MSEQAIETEKRPVYTVEDILGAIEKTWARLETIVNRLGPVLDAGPDAGGWNTRQVLSHIVGAWQRVPVHTGFFLAGLDAPILVGHDYWIPEWEHAPLESFKLAMRTAYEGNKAFVRSLDPATFSKRAKTPFGEWVLGDMLMTSHAFHIGDFHAPQLETFLSRDEG